MNWAQNRDIMKSLHHISALLVVASTLLSSCSLLVSSPIHYPGPHHHHDSYESDSYGRHPHRNKKVYSGSFQVAPEGGIYEFECANDEFYISRIFDTSMPMPDLYTDSRYSQTSSDYIYVNDLTYEGSFYTITCNKDKHNWIIEVDPLLAVPGEFGTREIWVFMWDGSDDSNFVFHFEQSDDDSFECIE